MPQRPLYWLSLIVVVGFLSSYLYLAVIESLALTVTLVVATISVCGYILLTYKRKGAMICLVWFISAGYYAILDSFNQTELVYTTEEQPIEGVILSSAKIDGDLLKFTMRINKIGGISVNEKTECRVPLKTVTQLEQAKLLRAGSTLQFSSPILPIDPPRNPGAFHYKRYMYYKGIHGILQPESFSALSIQSPPTLHFRYLLDGLQRKFASTVDSLYPAPSNSMIKGLLLGMRDEIPTEITETYSKLGLIHVLAISGLHMAVLIGGLLKLGEWAGLTRETRMVVGMTFIPMYVILVGAAPSVVRAGMMAFAVLLGFYLQRSRDSLNLLGAACILMLAYNPYQIWDVGFQLSFVVTWGLLVLTPVLTEQMQRLFPWLRSLLAVSLSAQLASLPIILFYFNQIHLLSLLINLLFVPLFSLFIIPFGFLSLIFGFFHPSLSFLLAGSITSLLGWIYPVLEWVTEIDSLRFYFSSPPLWWIFIYYIVFSLLPIVIRKNKRIYRPFFCLLLLLFTPLFSFQEEKVVITFLDVGQGDAIVIETKQHVYLIDSGGVPVFYSEQETWKQRKDPYDPGKRIILPFLKSKGIEKIDTVIMTHGDSDHIGGMLSVLKEMRVNMVVGNGKKPSTPIEKELLAYLKEKDIPLYWGKRGDHWNEGSDVVWSILHPKEQPQTLNDNNQSIVLLLEAFGRRILFTGDLEKEGEKILLSSKLRGPIDLLKVGHHGSRTSTQKAWVERLKPDVSIISVGKRNRYGHPHQDTISTLTEFGSEIFRTDQHGSITIEIKKNGWKVFTSLQPNGESKRLEK